MGGKGDKRWGERIVNTRHHTGVVSVRRGTRGKKIPSGRRKGAEIKEIC